MKILILLILLLPLHLYSQESLWEKIDSVNSNYYSGIACADALHCMAVANFQFQGAAVIRRTTDGGASWQNVYEDKFESNGSNIHIPDLVRCIAYPTPDLCIVGADSGIILRSTDAGTTWQRIEMGITKSFTLVRMLDAQRGVIVSAEGFAYTTGDGGETWQSAPLPPLTSDIGLWDVAWFPPQTWKWLVLAETGYSVFSTENGGESWESFTGPAYTTAWRFHDALHGIAVGGREEDSKVYNLIYRTEDGGSTWSTVYNEATEPYGVLLNVAFSDALHGVAGCSSGKILYTADGGASWQVQQTGLPAGSAVTSLAFPTADIAFATSYYGEILRFSSASVRIDEGIQFLSDVLTVSPNPSSDIIRIRVAAHEPTASLSLYSSLGQKVFELTSSLQSTNHFSPTVIECPVRSLVAGVYFLHYDSSSGEYTIPVYIRR